MHIKHTPILVALLLSYSFEASALNVNGVLPATLPKAVDDYISTVIGTFTIAKGNVSSNDRYGTTFALNGSWVGQYDLITSFDSDGEYTYQLFESTDNSSLPSGGVGIERFTYTYANESGQTDTAQIIIDVNPDPNLSGGSKAPIARNDATTVIPNQIPKVTGNLTDNDSNGNYAILTSSPSSDYGIIVLQQDGSYTYGLYETSPNVIELKAGEVVTDEFEYQYLANSGESSTAKLIVTIIGNPVDSNGDTIFGQPDDQPYDNVDVEFNNHSRDATPLNSGRNIKGHLYNSGDKDWYVLSSAGDEIITLEVCPQGTSCFDKKSWVLYVFDSDLLTPAMEVRLFEFSRWVDDTGTTTDESGQQIISGLAGRSNHMYLAYRTGFFDGALIGIVDPCFDQLNTVEIGVGAGARNYLIAISSPLLGNGNSGTDNTKCGSGSVVLEQAGRNALGTDGEGEAKSYTTTEETIAAFPYSDDQYAIKITGTGINPLSTEEAVRNAANFDSLTGKLRIPKVRVDEKMYEVELDQPVLQARSSDGGINFILTAIEELSIDEVVDAYRATFNPENGEVLIPRVTDSSSGIGYSVILQYHAADDENAQAWFDVISIVGIK